MNSRNDRRVALRYALSDDDVETARKLFREYEQWLGMDLCFQGFEAELRELPGKYAPPDGRLILAELDGEPVGCIAIRKIGPDICEMKRLYLRDAARGVGLGREMIERVLADARTIGYSKMRLDTFPPKMGKAVGLYKSYGFCPIDAYYENPHDGVLFMEADL